MSRRKSKYQENSDEIGSTSFGTPRTAEITNGVRLSRSGRKLTPTTKPSFIYENEAKIRDSQEKRKKAALAASSRKKMTEEAPASSDGSEPFETNDDPMAVYEPTELFSMDRDVAGKNLYGFRTPKKRNALATLVANTPKTPKTPASALQALSLNSPRTPKSNRKELAQLSTKTPHRERDKLKKEMKKRLVEESEDEFKVSDDDEEDPNYRGSESDSESDSDSSASEVEGAQAQPTKRKNKMLKNVRVTNQPIEIVSSRSARLQRRNRMAEPEFMPQSDNYFSAASTKKVTMGRWYILYISSSPDYHFLFAGKNIRSHFGPTEIIRFAIRRYFRIASRL